MDQNPNTPPPNTNQDSQTSPLGFSQYQTYINLLQTSPNFPNPNMYPQTSPPMQFPSSPYFHGQPNVFVGGGSSSQLPQQTQPRPQRMRPQVSQPNFETQETTQVREEEEAPQQRRGGRRGKRAIDAQNGPKFWTEEEHVALAAAWCATTKNPIKGNQQKRESYWESILNNFHERMKKGVYRNEDALSGKWRELNNKTTKFNGIYNNIQSERQSGASQFDVYRAAKERYRAEMGQPFDYEKPWEIMRRDPKWVQTQTFQQTQAGAQSQSQSKRSKTSSSRDVSDAHTNIDLNADTDEFPDDIEEVEPPQRPIGRDKAKRAARFAQDKQTKTQHMEDMEQNFKRHLVVQEKKVEQREKHLEILRRQEARQEELLRLEEERRQEEARRREEEQLARAEERVAHDIEILRTSEEGFEGEDLAMLRALKNKIRAKIRNQL